MGEMFEWILPVQPRIKPVICFCRALLDRLGD